MVGFDPYHDPQQGGWPQDPPQQWQAPRQDSQPQRQSQQPPQNQPPQWQSQQDPWQTQQDSWRAQQPQQNQPPQWQSQQPPQWQTPQNPWQSPQPQEKQRLKKLDGKTARLVKWIGIPVACVAVLAVAALVFGGTILTRLAPGAALSRGTAKLTNAVEKRLQSTPYQAIAVLGKTLAGGGSIDGEFVWYDDYDDVSGTFELCMAPKERSYSFGADVTADGRQMDAVLYINAERAALKSSLLPDCYGVTYETFASDLKKSALAQYLSPEQLDEITTAMEQIQDLLKESGGEGYEKLVEEYENLIDDFLDSLKLKGSSEKVEVGGKRVSCDSVSTTITEREIEKLAKGFVEVTFEDSAIREAVILQLTAQGYYSEAEAERELDKMCDSILEELEHEMDSVDFELDIKWYLYSGRVVLINVDGKVDSDGSAFSGSMDFGRDPAQDDWVLTLTSDQGESLVITYSSTSSGSDYEDSLTVSENGSTGLSFGTEWNRKDGDLKLSLDDGYDRTAYRCLLLVGESNFELTLKNFGDLLSSDEHLEIYIASDTSATVENPSFINLDKWDQDVLSDFEDAASALSSY